MADVERAVERRLREAAGDVLSLNLPDLDIEQLERRIAIIAGLQDLRPIGDEIASTCGTFTCVSYK